MWFRWSRHSPLGQHMVDSENMSETALVIADSSDGRNCVSLKWRQIYDESVGSQCTVSDLSRDQLEILRRLSRVEMVSVFSVNGETSSPWGNIFYRITNVAESGSAMLLGKLVTIKFRAYPRAEEQRILHSCAHTAALRHLKGRVGTRLPTTYVTEKGTCGILLASVFTGMSFRCPV